MLPGALAEIVVLRTAQAIDCGHVFDRHLPLARAAGVGEQQIAEIGRWPDSATFTAAHPPITPLAAAAQFARAAAPRPAARSR